MACNHSMAPANTGNDGDAPLAVAVTKGFGDTDSACNHSMAPANTGNDGDAPLAVVVTKGLGDTGLTQFNVRFPLNNTIILGF